MGENSEPKQLPDVILIRFQRLGQYLRLQGYGVDANGFNHAAKDGNRFIEDVAMPQGLALPEREWFFDAPDMGHGVLVPLGFAPLQRPWKECIRCLKKAGYDVRRLAHPLPKTVPNPTSPAGHDLGAQVVSSVCQAVGRPRKAPPVPRLIVLDLGCASFPAMGFLDATLQPPRIDHQEMTATVNWLDSVIDQLRAKNPPSPGSPYLVVLATDHQSPWPVEPEPLTVVSKQVYDNYHPVKSWQPPGWTGDLAFNRPIGDRAHLQWWVHWLYSGNQFGLDGSAGDDLGDLGREVVDNTTALMAWLRAQGDRLPLIPPPMVTSRSDGVGFGIEITCVPRLGVLDYLDRVRAAVRPVEASTPNEPASPLSAVLDRMEKVILSINGSRTDGQKPVKDKGRGRGRPRISGAKAKFREEICEQWREARLDDQSMKFFCDQLKRKRLEKDDWPEEPTVTPALLAKFVNFRAARLRREQP